MTTAGEMIAAREMISAGEMIAAGELGEIPGCRGIHAEDDMTDAQGAFSFRHHPAGGGALADIGSHAPATAELLCGPVCGPVCGSSATV